MGTKAEIGTHTHSLLSGLAVSIVSTAYDLFAFKRRRQLLQFFFVAILSMHTCVCVCV